MSSISDRFSTRSSRAWRDGRQSPTQRSDQLAMLERLAHWLDDAFRVPLFGTRLGLDAIIGLVPGIGDAVTALASLFIVHAASRYGAPRATLMRMGLNVAIDYFIGAIPILGDLFDVYWKSNLKNVELLRRYLYSTPQQKRRHRWSDRLFVAVVLLVVVAVIVASIGVVLLILTWLGRAIFG